MKTDFTAFVLLKLISTKNDMEKIMNYVKSFVIAAMVLTSGNVWGDMAIPVPNGDFSTTQTHNAELNENPWHHYAPSGYGKVCWQNTGAVEGYNKKFDFYQTITGIENGLYLVSVKGFYRNGSNEGGDDQNAVLYADGGQEVSVPLTLIKQKYTDSNPGVGNWRKWNKDWHDYYIPDDITAADYAIHNLGSYDNNRLLVNVTNGSLKIGVKKTTAKSSDWCYVDDFSVTKVSANNVTTKSTNGFSVSNKRSCALGGNHCNFVLSANKDISTSGGNLKIGNETKLDLRWNAADGYSVVVNNVLVKFTRDGVGGSNHYFKIGDQELNPAPASDRTLIVNSTYLADKTSIGLENGGVTFYIKEITIYYTVTPNTYSVVFNGNGSTHNSMLAQSFTYDEQQNLTPNAFEKKFVVAYDATTNGGSCSEESAESAETFLGWAESSTGEKKYDNNGSVENLTTVNNGTVNLYALWSGTKNSITLPEATKTSAVLDGWYDGDTRVGAAGASYSPTKDVTLVARFSTKKTPLFTPNFTISQASGLYVDGTISSAFSIENVDENLQVAVTATSIDPIHDGDAVIAYDKESNTITALNAGTATIKFTQPGSDELYQGESETFEFTVSKIANTLVADAVEKTLLVDEEWENVMSDKNSDAEVTTTSTDSELAYYDVENNKIVAPNSGNKASGSTATIHIQQAETYKYTGVDKEIVVTVNKHANTIAIKYGDSDITNDEINVGYGDSRTLTVSSDNSAVIFGYNQTAGTNIASLIGTTVVVSYKDGKATWTVSQAEDYKYEAAADVTFSVNVQADAEEKCYLVETDNTDIQVSKNTIQWIWENEHHLPIVGALTFDAKKSSSLSSITLTQNERRDGDWTKIGDIKGSLKDNYSTFTDKVISQTAEGLSFTDDASSYKSYVRNVKVEKLTFLQVKDENTAVKPLVLPTIQQNKSSEATFMVQFSTCSGGDYTLVSNNAHFTLNKQTIDASAGYGAQEIKVTYSNSEEIAKETAEITIYNRTQKLIVYLQGSTVGKLNTHIVYDGQTQYKETDAYDNESNFIGIANPFRVYDENNDLIVDAIITLATSNANIMATVDGMLIPYCGGEVTITATYAGNEKYNGSDKDQVITVPLCEGYIDWDQMFMTYLTTDAGSETELTPKFYDKAGVEIEGVVFNYVTDDANVATITADKKLKIVGAGETVLTGSVVAGVVDARGAKYAAVSLNKDVRVRVYGSKCDSYLSVVGNTQNFEGNTKGEWTWNNPTGDLVKTNGGNANASFVASISGAATRGTFKVYQRVNGTWIETTNSGKPGAGKTATVQCVLAANATGLQVEYSGIGLGSCTVRDVLVPMKSYLQKVGTENFAGTAEVYNEAVSNEISVRYSDVPNIQYEITNFVNNTDDNTLSDASITVVPSAEINNDCGDYGTYTFKVKATSTKVGTIEAKLRLYTSANDELEIPITLTFTPATRAINWDIDALNSSYPSLSADLEAYGSTVYEPTSAGSVKYSVEKGADLVTLDEENKKITFNKAGNVTVRATLVASKEYTDPAVKYIEKSWNVGKLNTQATTEDGFITSTITYGDQSSAVHYDEAKWSAKDIQFNNPVAGTIVYYGPASFDAAGKTNLIFNFNPTDVVNYESSQFKVEVDVQKKASDATATAAAITYGQKVSESVLSKDGEEGTWAWNAAIANDVPNAGTHDFAAHFVPTNTNMTELDATVSLTVNKAAAELSWTANPTSATYGDADLTYTATSVSDGAISYSIVSGDDIASIDANTGVLTIIKTGNVTIQAVQAEGTNHLAAAAITTQLTIGKATPTITTAPTASDVTYTTNVTLAASTLSDDGEASVAGTFAWKTPTEALIVGTAGHTVVFTPTDNTLYNNIEFSVSVTVLSGKKIYDNGWSGNTAPTAKDDVEIKSDLVINDEVVVKGLTIDPGVKVTLEVNGSLTVNGASDDQANYGDLIINAGGQVVLNDAADLQIRNLELNTELGNRETAAKSSNLTGVDKLTLVGDAYIDITLDPDGVADYGYYGFALPFQVEATSGIYYVNNGAQQKLTINRDYAIMNYSEATAANGNYAWSWYTGTLQPGVFYSITVDASRNYNTLRFYKKASTAITPVSSKSLSSTGSSATRGWNGIGNGTLTYADLALDGVEKVQIYDHTTNTYAAIDKNQYSYVVGSAFFVQVDAAKEASFVKAETPTGLRAPLRVAQQSHEFMLEMTKDGESVNDDVLYLSVADDASNTYEIGRDLTKMGDPTDAKAGQIWCTAYGKKLCDVELPINGGETIFPVSMFAPAAGDYNLHVAKAVDGQKLYLLEDGIPMWELTAGDYLISLDKGTTANYSLMLSRPQGIVTDVENVGAEEAAEKIFINGVLYVERSGMIFDVNGKKVK